MPFEVRYEDERSDVVAEEKFDLSPGRAGGGRPLQGNPESGRWCSPGGDPTGVDCGLGVGSWRSSPGERGGRIGAPLVEMRYAWRGDSADAIGESAAILTTLSIPLPSESRLVRLEGMLSRGPRKDFRPPSTSPKGPRSASAMERDDECGGMYAIGIMLVEAEEQKEKSDALAERPWTEASSSKGLSRSD